MLCDCKLKLRVSALGFFKARFRDVMIKKFLIVLTVIFMFSLSAVSAFSEEESVALSSNATGAELLAKMAPASFVGSDGKVMNYRIYYSPGYDGGDPSKPAKLILFLHGLGERGSDNEKQITGIDSPLNYILSDRNDSRYLDESYIVIAPQCPEDDYWVNVDFSKGSYSLDEVGMSSALSRADELLDFVAENENVDPQQLLAVGISMGGYGVWNLAMNFPDKFAGIVPMCGGGDPDKAVLIADMRIWAFHCADDSAVPVSASRDMAEALKKYGSQMRYTEYEEGGHAVWRVAANESEPPLAEWLIVESKFAKTFEVKTSCSKGGVITQSFDDVNYGGSAIVNISPDRGYVLSKVIVDDDEIPFFELSDDGEGVYSYVLKNVTADSTVRAEFTVEEEEKTIGNKKSTVDKLVKALPLIAAGCAALGLAFWLAASKKKKN